MASSSKGVFTNVGPKVARMFSTEGGFAFLGVGGGSVLVSSFVLRFWRNKKC